MLQRWWNPNRCRNLLKVSAFQLPDLLKQGIGALFFFLFLPKMAVSAKMTVSRKCVRLLTDTFLVWINDGGLKGLYISAVQNCGFFPHKYTKLCHQGFFPKNLWEVHIPKEWTWTSPALFQYLTAISSIGKTWLAGWAMCYLYMLLILFLLLPCAVFLIDWQRTI